MSWIHDELDDRERLQRDRATIELHAEAVYEELWSEISDRVADAAKRGMSARTNGSNYERTVLMGGPIVGGVYRTRSEKLRQLTIRLNKAAGKIEVADDTDDRSIEMLLMVCENGIVRPSYQGRVLTIPEAAQMILRPFLFPSAE